MEDLRLKSNLHKSDVYRGVGVAKTTYDAWIEGRSLPDLSKAVALAKLLKTSLYVICDAFGIDTDGLGEINPPDGFYSDKPGDSDYDALVRVLKTSPNEDAAAIIRLLVNKKDDGPIPPSGVPS